MSNDMACPHCGQQIPANSTFCPSCGKAVGNEAVHSTTTTTTSRPQQAKTYNEQRAEAQRQAQRQANAWQQRQPAEPEDNDDNDNDNGSRSHFDRNLIIGIVAAALIIGLLSMLRHCNSQENDKCNCPEIFQKWLGA
jgi:cation transport ATPase